MIMALFHALCGFVHGLDVVSEVDLIQVPTFSDKSTRHPEKSAEIYESVESQSKLTRYRLHDEATRNLKVLLQTNLDVLIAKHGVDDPFELAGSDESTRLLICLNSSSNIAVQRSQKSLLIPRAKSQRRQKNPRRRICCIPNTLVMWNRR